MKDMETAESSVRVIESFDALPLDRRIRIFSELSPEAREELVRVVARPGEIVRQMSEEEMFFTVKKLGEEHAPGLITFTTGRQFLYLLDLDLWKKDMLHFESAGRWLNMIAAMGEGKILQFVQVTDSELIVSLMNAFVKVRIRNPDIDLVEDSDTLPPFTLDDLFFVKFSSPAHEEALKRFLQTIFEWNTEYYFGLMEELARGIHLENQEEARRLRMARLADRGFPEFDEAVEIYAYIQRGALSYSPPEPFDERVEPYEAPRNVLKYPLKVLEPDTLFKKALDEISDPHERDRLSQELAHLANKVMVADARDPGQVDDLHGSLRKVSGYINIALEELSREDISKATNLLRSNHMEYLFRRGFSLILDLRKEAQKLLRSYEGGVENLGHPLAGLIQGLLQKRPLYASTTLGEKKPREFESLDDINLIRGLLNRAGTEESWEPV
ncbi:MAG: hypothetical protein HY913_09755 [Desulfomonile tiedjei]|nr:hypothetical protein [Desulfomonile tiedjei]